MSCPSTPRPIDGHFATDCGERRLRVRHPGDGSLLAEAVGRANALPCGLAAYAFGRDLAAAHRLGQELQAGVMGINRFGVSQPETPFGGIEDSGVGHESGFEGLLGCTEPRLVRVAAP